MAPYAILSLTALLLATEINASPTITPRNSTQLTHWPPAAAASLNTMIRLNANTSAYAVFDADNTIWRYDLEESTIPYLENIGVLTRQNLDPALKLIPFKDTATYTESLYSYYLRLCDIDDMLCYPWAAQVFSGLSLRTLKSHVDDLLALNTTIPTTYWSSNDTVVHTEVNHPVIFRGQVELINKLAENGIMPWIVSAAHEEIVRMVVSDPKYGFNIPADNVLGVTTLLSNPLTGELTTARKQIAEGNYNQEANLDLVLGSYLWTPATWYAGKWAAVQTYIDEWKAPVLGAGDTPGSDTYMLFGVDVSGKGGKRVWVDRGAAKLDELKGLISEGARRQGEQGEKVDADKGWVVVKPEDIL